MCSLCLAERAADSTASSSASARTPRLTRSWRSAAGLPRSVLAIEAPQPDDGPMGNLISLAGMDGAGKTTQAKLLGQWLRDRGHTVAIEAPPGPSLLRRTLADLAEQRGVADYHDVFGAEVTHLFHAL